MKIDIKDTFVKYYLLVITLITLPTVIYSYLMVVFNDDTHIFLGVARLADAMGSFPANVDMAWSTHPIGLRMVYYILYKLTGFEYGNEFALQVLTKGIVAIIILCTSYYFAQQVKQKLPILNVYTVFLITTLSFFTLHIMFLLESEFFAAIFSILAIALLLSDSRKANIAAGSLLVLIILMKVVTVVFIPVILAAWILITGYYKSEKLFNCLFGFELASIAFVAACLLWFKNFIPDFFLMLALHDPTGYGLQTRIYMMVIQSLAVGWFMPILMAGAITGVVVFYDLMKYNTRFQQLSFIIMWISPLTLVFIQSEFFMYHYVGLIIPSVVSIILFMTINYPKYQELIFILIIALILLIFGITSSVWQDTHEHIWDNQISNTTIIKEKYNISAQPSILYLDTGITAYWLGAPSACRYTYPLVIRRGYSLGLSESIYYKTAKECIMNYTGDYVVALNGDASDPEINAKLSNEYIKVYAGTRWGVSASTGDIYKRNIRTQQTN